ncbi:MULTISPECIES: RNA-guided endonuclease InsQ/TnpB family protein [Kamptonema]|uniref:RNA-guided endonuclease InsQ/TnpB family protein n=1 Tax=Kamptonema TaxID=1501433 RepID=UPI0001DACF6D|nr:MULTISPECIES: RNA-guided endonuclease TnpB family protein [Kamptonema]CBN57636.1 transposase [Kamptonema sp. PCC 6506]
MYAIKLELKLNNKERTLMARHSGYARFCYNYALNLYQEVKSLPGGSSKKVAAIERIFTNHVKKMPEYQWTNTLSSRVYKMTFRHFSEALSRFFKGLGEFPKFKRKKDGDSFTVDAADWNHSVLLAANKSIKIPTLGKFRLKESIPFPCVAQTFTISRTADKWYVSFAIKAEKIPPMFHPVTEPVGIDLGVSTFATISDGNSYESPRPLTQAKTKLSKAQWRNRKKQLGNRKLGVRASKNAIIHYRRIAKIHAKTANVRRDFLQKTTTEISQKYAHIRIEDLNVSGMIANHKLAAAISDCGFYEFRRQLTYKTEMYGTKVELVDRWFPSSKTCSNCGHVQSMPLKERVFNCGGCNLLINRDLNAAINLSRCSEKVRLAQSEVTPVDKKESTPLVEAGSEHQICRR